MLGCKGLIKKQIQVTKPLVDGVLLSLSIDYFTFLRGNLIISTIC